MIGQQRDGASTPWRRHSTWATSHNGFSFFGLYGSRPHRQASPISFSKGCRPLLRIAKLGAALINARWKLRQCYTFRVIKDWRTSRTEPWSFLIHAITETSFFGLNLVLFFLGILRLLRTMIVGQPPCDKIVVSSFSGQVSADSSFPEEAAQGEVSSRVKIRCES